MSTAPSVYRDGGLVARWRCEELLPQRMRELEAARQDLRGVLARRIGRIAAGAIVTLAALAMPVAAIVWGDAAPLTPILLSAAPLAVLGYVVARLAARLWIGRALARSLRMTGNVHSDLAKLEETSPRGIARSWAGRLETWSIGFPLSAISLVVPLTLHLPVALLIGESADYDDWILWSMVIVGHSHLVLAGLTWRFARQIKRMETLYVHGGAACRESWSAYGWTLLSSLVPGLLLIAIPPALVAITGLAFIPAAFAWMKRRIAKERLILEG